MRGADPRQAYENLDSASVRIQRHKVQPTDLRAVTFALLLPPYAV